MEKRIRENPARTFLKEKDVSLVFFYDVNRVPFFIESVCDLLGGLHASCPDPDPVINL